MGANSILKSGWQRSILAGATLLQCPGANESIAGAQDPFVKPGNARALRRIRGLDSTGFSRPIRQAIPVTQIFPSGELLFGDLQSRAENWRDPQPPSLLILNHLFWVFFNEWIQLNFGIRPPSFWPSIQPMPPASGTASATF